MPHPSHRTSRTDLVYGSCILHIPSTYCLNADSASHPVLTYSIEYNPSSSNQLLGIAKLDKGLCALRHEFMAVYTLTALIVDVTLMAFLQYSI